MKQIAQYQDGRIELRDVPMPTPPPGGILVRTTHSVISIGTEKMKVEQAKMNLLQKARARPDQVRKVLDTAKTLGWKSAIEKVQNRLSTPTPLGYSAAGIVEAVDRANTRFGVGDLVACAGAECAFHAEYLAIPDMLAAPVPAGVQGWQAAYTTVSSIAMQAVRQAEVQIGERVVVLGQGLIGLLVTNLLAIAGVRVMAGDLLPARRALCAALGAERTVIIGEQDLVNEAHAWTEGHGVDTTIICTATDSNSPVVQAAKIARDRGRIVIVGITKVELPRGAFYEKELDIRFSRSYGPGRYEPSYEWAGNDYPIGYVRWTEQRNFQACLALMQQDKLKLGALTTRRVPFADAVSVYKELADGTSHDVGIVLEYINMARPVETRHAASLPEPGPTESVPNSSPHVAKPVDGLDVIGAGNFARTMLLPHLRGKISFGTIVNQTALSAQHVRSTFGFRESSTDVGAAMADAVLIATRHHLHAPLVISSLAKHRHVFVEKPLCLTLEELFKIDAAIGASRGTVQVGFNRRFAPATAELMKALAGVPGPRTISYRIVPGRLDPRSWYANYDESGGRVLGEACHFFDYCCHIAGGAPVRVFARTTWPASGRLPFPDSVAAQIEFADGSCGQITYTAEASTKFPKETITVFASGLTAELSNFQRLEIHTDSGSKNWLARRRLGEGGKFSSKGHAEQMAAWLEFLQGRGEHPLPYAQSRQSMLLTFAALRSIQENAAVDIKTLA